MILSPYYVPWAFFTYALLLIAFGVTWLVFHATAARLMERLWLSDAVIPWPLFAAFYHAWRRVEGDSAGALADNLTLVLLWGSGALYFLLRLTPTPLRRRTVLLGLALLAWAWAIGAGFQYLELLESAENTLRERPDQVLSGTPPLLAPLRQALTLARLPEQQRELTTRLIADLAARRSLGPGQLTGARHVLIPNLLKYFERDLSRLRTYLVLQIIMLAALLLVWGYGGPPPKGAGRPLD